MAKDRIGYDMLFSKVCKYMVNKNHFLGLREAIASITPRSTPIGRGYFS